MSRRTLARLVIAALLIAGIAAFFLLDLGQYLTLAELREHRDALLAWTQDHFLLAVAVYFAVYVVMAALSVPGAAVITLAGGALFGLLAGTIVVSFASTIGATGVFPWTFYWVSQLGMLPGTIVFVNAGTQLAEVDRVGDIFSPGLIGAFVLLGVMPLLLRWILNWLQRRRVYRGHARPKSFDYNLLVIGGGSAGLVSAYIGATIKAKVALVEQSKLGGDCLNTGCVPSKALLRTARLIAEARESRKYGIRNMDVDMDFGEVMDRVREVIRKIEPHDSRERYEGMGVEVFEDHAELVSPWEVRVGERTLTARAIVLATGAEPLVPHIEGLDGIDYLTSENLWDLETLPERLVVLGGGPIGCELSQAFARLGSTVTVVEMADRLLPREDAEAGEALKTRFEEEGLRVATAHKAVRVESDAGGQRLVCEHDGERTGFAFTHLLVALGRKARVTGYGLETLGIELTDRGTVRCDERQRTRFPNITVCGDAAGPYQFTHVASHQAWTAAVNGLLYPFWSFRTDYRVIPWVTFTDPEVAHVGLSEDQAREQDIDYELTVYGLDDLDRAITDSADYGSVRVLTEPGRDRILGATIIGAHAGEMLQEFTLAMKHGLGLNRLLGTIHPYPTYGEGNRFSAGEWKRTHAPQSVLDISGRFFAWRR